MKSDKRLQLIKILLKDIVNKIREDEDFMQVLNDNKSSFDIEINPITSMSYEEIAEVLEIKEEDIDETVDKLDNFFHRKEIHVDELVEEFCKMYDV